LCQPELVIIDPSKAAISLAIFSEFVFHMMSSPCPANEATSSAQLYHLTGDFLNFKNDNAPADRKLQGLDSILDSGNPTSSEAASQALEPLLRPDFQLFVRDCFILRWENKIANADLAEAVHENMSKLKVRSCLYYSTLPCVIGGCCAERQF